MTAFDKSGSLHVDLLIRGWRTPCYPCRFEGRMTVELVEELLGTNSAKPFATLDLPGMSLRDIQLSSTAMFQWLESLNLEGNDLVYFEPLSALPCLRVLCLDGNRIQRLSERSDHTELNARIN